MHIIYFALLIQALMRLSQLCLFNVSYHAMRLNRKFSYCLGVRFYNDQGYKSFTKTEVTCIMDRTSTELKGLILW